MNTPRGRGRREFHASLNKISIGILFASLDFTVFVAAEPTSRLEWSTFHAKRDPNCFTYVILQDVGDPVVYCTLYIRLE